MSNNEQKEETLMKTRDKCKSCGEPLDMYNNCTNENCEKCEKAK